MLYTVFPVAFSHIFDERPKSTKEYLSGLNKEDLILMVLHIAGINNKDSFSLGYRNFLRMFFQDFPESENPKMILQKIEELKIKSEINEGAGVVITFAEPRVALKLLKEIILMPQGGKEVKNEVDYMNFLKAYLVVSEEVQIHKRAVFDSIPVYKNSEFRKASFHFINGLLNLGLSDYNFHELHKTQLMKTLILIDFCRINSELNPILSLFNEKYKVKSLIDYVNNFWIIDVFEENKFKEGQISVTREILKNSKGTFDNLTALFSDYDICIDVNRISDACIKLSDMDDFSCFKKYPVLKINPDHYVIISRYFFVVNIYNGLILKLLDIGNVERFKDLKRFLTTNFSEEIIFYKVIDQIFRDNENKKNVYITGKTFEKLKEKGRPDYYIRNNKRILLFEHKDILMNKETRDTSDYSKIEEYFQTRLNKDKGIPQIVSNIKDIFDKKYKYDKGYNVSNIQIYPILVMQDRLFSIMGTNYILNEMFKEKLRSEPVLANYLNQIRPLIVIDIDILIIFSFNYNNNLDKFLSLVNSYYKYCELNPDFSSFRDYVLNENKIDVSHINKKALNGHYFKNLLS